MDIRLTIDQGNSRAKVCVFRDLDVIGRYTFESLSLESLLPILEQYDIDDAVYCTVGRLDTRFVESLRLLMRDRLLVVTHNTPLPIAVDYRTPETLGLDRVAAAVGAASIWPGEPLLIVDAGTAITIDVLDANNTFRGGNIAPGISLRLAALNRFTANLPIVDVKGDLPPFGYDTHTAIRCGVVRGMADEIVGAFARARALYGASRLVLTGGDAPVLLKLLTELPVEIEPNLTDIGLQRILNHNENI